MNGNRKNYAKRNYKHNYIYCLMNSINNRHFDMYKKVKNVAIC